MMAGMKTNRCSTLRTVTTFLIAGFSTALVAAPVPIHSLPAKITKPGSYILIKSLVLKTPTATAAITITADNVKLDLGGHTLTNTLPATADVTGVYAQAHGGITVSNGTVRGFSTGVRLNAFQAAAGDVSVENVRVDGCRNLGLQLLGSIGSVRRCVVSNTGGATANSASGISLDLAFATVVDNDVFATITQPTTNSVGIQCGAQAGVFENNRVLNEQSNRGGKGMSLAFSANYLVEKNFVTGFATGISFTNAATPKYRNNFTTDCATPYVLGVDAGNNK